MGGWEGEGMGEQTDRQVGGWTGRWTDGGRDMDEGQGMDEQRWMNK